MSKMGKRDIYLDRHKTTHLHIRLHTKCWKNDREIEGNEPESECVYNVIYKNCQRTSIFMSQCESYDCAKTNGNEKNHTSMQIN